MSTRTLPRPSLLRDQLENEIPGIRVKITPRDAAGGQCPVYDAAFYEVAAFYVAMGTPLDEAEATLRARPGTARTTQITGNPATIRDPDWPGFTRRRDRETLRPHVLAMITDPPPTEETSPHA